MADLSVHPVYLSARAAIVAPERAIPVSLYALQKWLPRLGPERWCLIMLLRGLCIDTPRRSDGTKRITCSWRELAEMLDVHEETVASWLKHKPIPNDKPWRSIIPVDEKAKNLALFIPRLRYAYETHHGKTRRVGFLLEVLMEDPIVPEDETKLQQQVELLRMQQGELGLETYRLNENVNVKASDLPQISQASSNPQNLDTRYVNRQEVELPVEANPNQAGSHNVLVNPDSSDLPVDVKQDYADLDSYVNPLIPSLHKYKSEKSGKNVNELIILIQQLKQYNPRKRPQKDIFEPIVRLTEDLLLDNHSTAMLYKVLTALYPERLDLYIQAVEVSLQAAETQPQVNRGAVFVRALRELADGAGVDLGLKSTTNSEEVRSESHELLGTWVPTAPPPALSPPSVDEAIWAETQSTLRHQMARATYDALIQGTKLLGRENGIYVIGVQSEMAKEWLENRLRGTVQRALSSVLGVTVEVEFRLLNVSG